MIQESNRNAGHLHCDNCNTLWCEHIEEYVKNFEDADEIWEIHPSEQFIEVPIVPTANVWASARLVPPEDGKKNYHLIITESVDPFKDTFIGFVHPGEARMTFREMILNWFVGEYQYKVSEIGCTAAGHGYHETVRWNKDMLNEGKRLVQHWTLFMTGKCLGCTYDPTQNAALVPEVELTNPWSR